MFGGVWLAQSTGGAISFPLFGSQILGKEGDTAGHRLAPRPARHGPGDPVDRRVLADTCGPRCSTSCRQDYVRTAKAKGLSGNKVIAKHALRNALIPFITLIGLSLPASSPGAVITEAIFSYPGLGSLTINAIGANDFPVVYATGDADRVLRDPREPRRGHPVRRGRSTHQVLEVSPMQSVDVRTGTLVGTPRPGDRRGRPRPGPDLLAARPPALPPPPAGGHRARRAGHHDRGLRRSSRSSTGDAYKTLEPPAHQRRARRSRRRWATTRSGRTSSCG